MSELEIYRFEELIKEVQQLKSCLTGIGFAFILLLISLIIFLIVIFFKDSKHD